MNARVLYKKESSVYSAMTDYGVFMTIKLELKDDPLSRAIKAAGSVEKLAKMMTLHGPGGLSRMTVYLWARPGKRVPAEYCPDIERLTGVTCEELRPDVNWGYLRGTKQVIKSSKLD